MQFTDMRCLMIVTLVSAVWCAPLTHDVERNPLSVVSDLTSAVSGLSARVASRAGLLPERDPRLLPTPQDLETIRKVAQILIMLGDQVLPSVFEPPRKPPTPVCESPQQEIPDDSVKDR